MHKSYTLATSQEKIPILRLHLMMHITSNNHGYALQQKTQKRTTVAKRSSIASSLEDFEDAEEASQHKQNE